MSLTGVGHLTAAVAFRQHDHAGARGLKLFDVAVHSTSRGRTERARGKPCRSLSWSGIVDAEILHVLRQWLPAIQQFLQFGVSNVVATMGTAVTEEHIKTLFKMCDHICYSFDGDSAGKKAAWRALERSIALVTDIKAGEKVCIAGYNGSGKTTLVQIISCFLNDFQGSVLYNGIPRRNFNQKSLRTYIGDYSSQEDIFKGTLRENIDLGNPNISFEEVVKIAETVGLNSLVRSLSQGFDTMLLPEGKNLPRNSKAKIILARSLVSKPQLLAIEELMANIELRDRTHIAQLLTDRKQSWTLVAVTDDPILAAQCDRIFIMKEGRIVEEGDFEKIRYSSHFKKVFKVSNYE